MISTPRMESSRSNQKPLVRERELPKHVALGRTLLGLAIALAAVLVVAARSLAPLSAGAAATVAFPVLIELRALSRTGTRSLEGEPWGIDAVSLLTASVCILAMASISPFAAWATAWFEVWVLGALGRRATR
jgi:hypothetical protein